MTKKAEKESAITVVHTAEIVDEAKTIVVRTDSSSLVKPLATPEQAAAEFKLYIELCKAILEDGDYTYTVYYTGKDGSEGSPVTFSVRAMAESKVADLEKMGMKYVRFIARKKRSAWDKLARYFGLTIPQFDVVSSEPLISQVGDFIIETRRGRALTLIIYQQAKDLQIVKASVTVAVTAPNGRIAVGDGICSASERKNGIASFTHADHDIPTTAYTRALNRAISRCLGTGETSAEEIGGEITGGEQSTGLASAPTASVPVKKSEEVKEDPKPAKETTKPVETCIIDRRNNLPRNSTLVQEEPEKPVEKPAEKKKAEPKVEKVAPKEESKAVVAFVPLGPSANFGDRLKYVEEFVYGSACTDTQRSAQLVKYALFMVPEPKKADIETPKKLWDAQKWKAAMLAIPKEERAKRIGVLENFAKDVGAAEFLKWSGSLAAEMWG